MDERATNLLNAHREKLPYLVIGGWNTLFQYRVFSLLVPSEPCLARDPNSAHVLPPRFSQRLPRLSLNRFQAEAASSPRVPHVSRGVYAVVCAQLVAIASASETHPPQHLRDPGALRHLCHHRRLSGQQVRHLPAARAADSCRQATQSSWGRRLRSQSGAISLARSSVDFKTRSRRPNDTT